MKRITLELPDDVAKDLSEAATRDHTTAEAVAQDMLRRMVALQNVERLRNEVQGSLRPGSPRSEAEIFEEIS